MTPFNQVTLNTVRKPPNMSNIIPFNFESHNIRVTQDDNGEPWFVAKDICEVLEYANPHKAVADHVDGDDLTKREVIDELGRPQKTNHINESGVYALIFGSKKESAKRFKRWVTAEVLPSIRKTGSYTAPKPKAQRARLPDEVKALLMIGKAVAQVPGVNPNLAMAYTLDAIEKTTGMAMRDVSRALPSVDINNAATLSPTTIGEKLGMSGTAINKKLADLGFQKKDAKGYWTLTDSGLNFGELKNFHKNGHSGYQILWKESIIDRLKTKEYA